MHLRPLILTALLLGALAVPASARAEEARYLTALPDVPVMDHFVETESENMVFDAPSGRIVETAVTGPETAPEIVMGYYAGLLPQLGWKPQKSGTFVRNGEQLTVIVDKVSGQTKVSFRLSPESD